LPDFGYNTISTLSWEGRKIFFTRKGRKAEPDLTLQFKDNAKGMRTWKNSPYSYGFDVKLYFGDSESAPPETLITEEFTIHNVYSDNVRVMINEKFNP
ncbi:MAG TPA: hypothetical protein DCM40_10365, partial [Maribacter sp.]|nr:hypothetical protein [Maribacter sp.]